MNCQKIMPVFYGNKGGQQKSFDNGVENKFFVGKDVKYTNKEGKEVGTKQYSSFINIDEFFKYEKDLIEDDKTCYETMIDERIEMYDIDGENSNPIFQNIMGEPATDDEIITEFIEARLEFNDMYCKDIPLSYKNFLIKKTDDPKGIKRSFHIIIRNGMKFLNTKDNKTFATDFQNYCKKNHYKVKIDLSIYSKNRLIRMLGHHKLGQTKRASYRYENTTSNRKLFFCSYLEGHEKPYDFKIPEKTEEQQADENFKDEIKMNFEKTTDSKIKILVDLILETIDKKMNPICDDEIPDKLNYCNWYKLVITVFNCIEDENLSKKLYKQLFTYYRHCKDINQDEYYTNLYSKKGEYKQLTINSLHYLARFNNNYKNEFATEIKVFNDKLNELRFKKRLDKAIKLENSQEYPIKYINEMPLLVQLSKKNHYTLQYIKNLVNTVICNICNGGDNSIFCKDTYYCDNSKEQLERYKQVKFEKLVKVSGFLNITVRYINTNYDKDLKKYEELPEKQKKKTDAPQRYITTILGSPKDSDSSVIKFMLQNNELQSYNRPIFKPYLNPTDSSLENYKDCLNLFTGYPYKIDDKISIDLYKNSKLRENLRKYLCNGDKEPENFTFIEKHTAHMLQKPTERCDMAIIMTGAQGTGKDMWMTLLSKLIGLEHYNDIASMDELFKSFNTNQQKKLLTRLNEISDKGIHFEKHNQLKEKITATQVRIEPKGFDSYQIDHLSRYYGFSQSENIVIVENTDRRFFMIKTDNTMANNREYFRELVKELEDVEIIKSCFNYYATLDIEGFEPQKFPNTSYKDEQKIQSLPNSLKFFNSLFEETTDNDYKKHRDDLYDEFMSWCNRSGLKYSSKINFMSDLKNLGIEEKRIRIKGKLLMGIVITVNCLEELFRNYLKNPNFTIKRMIHDDDENHNDDDDEIRPFKLNM